MSRALDAVAENRAVDAWWRVLSRHPQQAHGVHEADAELVPWPGTSDLLAVTTDTIAEEIALGFYREPRTIGWMAATVSLSDLAAVGAEPVGVVLAVTLPRGTDESTREALAAGVEAACRACGTYVLGGDTNTGDATAVTATAVGRVPAGAAMTRTGARAGDALYVTGGLGAGGACAARAVLSLPDALYAERDYRPRARLAEGRLCAPFASACIDTSDGLVAALDQLGRLNDVGFEVDLAPSALLEPRARAVADALSVDPLAFLAQPHGEFELALTVPAGRTAALEAASRDAGVELARIGRVVDEPVLRFTAPRVRTLDGGRLRSLAEDLGRDARHYLAALLAELQRQ